MESREKMLDDAELASRDRPNAGLSQSQMDSEDDRRWAARDRLPSHVRELLAEVGRLKSDLDAVISLSVRRVAEHSVMVMVFGPDMKPLVSRWDTDEEARETVLKGARHLSAAGLDPADAGEAKEKPCSA